MLGCRNVAASPVSYSIGDNRLALREQGGDGMFAEDRERFLLVQRAISHEDPETDAVKLPPSTTFEKIEALPVFNGGLETDRSRRCLVELS